MTILRTALTEFIGLFIDDGSLALFVAVLIAVVAAAVKFAGLAPLGGAFVLLAGCIAILADSLRRAARSRK